MYLPFFPPWLRAQRIEGVAFSVVMAIPPALGVIGPPLFGLAADALSLRGQMLRIASGIAAMAFLCMGFIPFVFDRPIHLIELIACLTVYSFFRSPLIPMADVIALEESKARGVRYASIRWWGSLGFLLAASLIGKLLEPTHKSALPMAIAVILACGFGASFALPARSAAASGAPVWREAKSLLKSWDFALFLVAAVVGQTAHTAYDVCFSLHLRDHGVSSAMTGVAWSIGVVFEIGLMAFGGALFERVRPQVLLACAFFGAAVRWLLIALIARPSVLIAIQPLHAISFGVMWVASLSNVKNRVPAGILATGQGVFSASIAAGCVLGVFLFGLLYEPAKGERTFFIASILSLVAAALMTVLALMSRNQRISLGR